LALSQGALWTGEHGDVAIHTDAAAPHLPHSTGARLETGAMPDKIVKTHCCFCGQQCGIKLKVKDEAVIGFEPW